jgi:hypothetical protein
MNFPAWVLLGAAWTCVATSVAAQAPAKAATAVAKLGARKVTLEYRDVPADSGPASAGVGTRWTFGGTAGALTTELPLQFGAALIAPGRYKVEIARTGEKEFALFVIHGETLGAGKRAVRDVEIPVTLGTTAAPAARCTAAFTATARPKESGRSTVKLELRAGAVTYAVEGVATAPSMRKSAGLEIDAWPLPATLFAERTAAGLETPFLTIRREDPRDRTKQAVQNLNVVGAEGLLATAPAGPDADGVSDPNAKDGYVLAVEWKDVKENTPTLAVPFFEVKKDIGSTFRIAEGSRVAQFFTRDPLFDQKNNR